MTAFNFSDRHGLMRLHQSSAGRKPTQTPKEKLKPVSYPKPDTVVLSDDQQAAFDEIMDWSMNHSSRIMSLIGAAGTGKTTLMRQIADEAAKRGWHVLLTAPTHRATAQLAKSTGRTAQTIYKALGLTLFESSDDGEHKLKSSGSSQVTDGTFLVVDEGSMLIKTLLERITTRAKKFDCRFLIVGDAAQLNPVKEPMCKAVCPDTCPWPLVELTEIHRQSEGNPIIRVATAVRTAGEGKIPKIVEDMVGDCGVRVIDSRGEWARMMVQACSTNTEDRYCGYTNAAVDAAAKAIRQAMYGDDAQQPYLPGELLIVNERHVIRKPGTGKKKGKRYFDVIENNTEVRVVSSHQEGEFYMVRCDVLGHELTLKAFGNYRQRKQYLNQLANQAKRSTQKKPWDPFWEANSGIADLRSATAQSIHKSQGQTFRDVYLNLDQMKACTQPIERPRLLYVGITRASRCVYLTGGDL